MSHLEVWILFNMQQPKHMEQDSVWKPKIGKIKYDKGFQLIETEDLE